MAGFEGFCVRDGLLMAEGTGEGDPPHAVTTLYVGNLAPLVDEYVLMTTFQFFGQITNIQVRARSPGTPLLLRSPFGPGFKGWTGSMQQVSSSSVR